MLNVPAHITLSTAPSANVVSWTLTHIRVAGLSRTPPVSLEDWKKIRTMVHEYSMLSPSWGGEKLGGKENARSVAQSIGKCCTVVRKLLCWEKNLKLCGYCVNSRDVLKVIRQCVLMRCATLPVYVSPVSPDQWDRY